MRSVLVFLTLILFTMSENAAAQASPCNAPECAQFDFWLGEWELSTNDTLKGTNHITKEMRGCVIHEHFSAVGNTYLGESWSVYNMQRKVWQQTWVDDQGAYIALTGTFANGKMTLFTEPAAMHDGTRKQNRMVFYNITPNSFDWDWEATTDEGKTWTNNWHLHYKRKK